MNPAVQQVSPAPAAPLSGNFAYPVTLGLQLLVSSLKEVLFLPYALPAHK